MNEEMKKVMKASLDARICIWLRHADDNLIRCFRRAVKRGVIEGEGSQSKYHVIDRGLDSMLSHVYVDLWGWLTDGPVWIKWAQHIPGMDWFALAVVLTEIRDISRFDNVAKLWKYCGLHVMIVCGGRGYAPRQRVGVKYPGNGKMRKYLGLIVDGLMKNKGAYWGMYNEYKTCKAKQWIVAGKRLWLDRAHYYDKEGLKEAGAGEHCAGKDERELHLHNMSLRYVAKQILAHIFQVWKTAQGVKPTLKYARYPDPYAFCVFPSPNNILKSETD